MMYRLLCAVVLTTAGVAADRGSWDNVRNIPVGTYVEARREDGAKFRGTLTRATENQLVLATKDGPVTLGRSTVRKVGVKSDSVIGWLMRGYKTVYNAPHGRKKP